MPQQSDDENQRLNPQDDVPPKAYNENLAFQELFCIKFATIVFFALTSLLLTVVNKSILTNYKFPSFSVVALSQMLTTIVVLSSLKYFRKIRFPDWHLGTFAEIFPQPIFYVGSIFLTLGATQELSLPTFTLLRRFAIPMTMIAEYYVLSVRPGSGVQLSVALIVFGGVVAAADDLSFDLKGYIHVMVANLFVACQAVSTKERLTNDQEMGKFGLMFYSCLYMFPVACLLVYYTDDGGLDLALNYSSWYDPFFFIQFVLSSTLGFILIFSGMLCTQYNSALTSNIVSCSKNIFATYLGMFIADDYIFSWMNFIGINISVFGSLLYTYVVFRPTERKRKVQSGESPPEHVSKV